MSTEWSYPNALFPKAPIRTDDLKFVLEQLSYGHHCALLGASNTGKSTLLNSLTTPAASQLLNERISFPPSQSDPNLPQQNINRSADESAIDSSNSHLARIGGNAQNMPFLVVFVDCLEAGDSEQALYEVIIRRVTEELSLNAAASLSATTLDHQELSEIHRSVLESTSELTFRSAFASGLRRLLRAAQCRLLLILDEFDDTFRSLPPWPFRQLRAAANQHGNRIQYVVATTQRLAYLRQDNQTYEFRELFQMATRRLMPLDADDSVRLMHYLDTQEPNPPQADLIKTIVEVTGGHSGLLERIHGLVSQRAIAIQANISPNKLIELLLQSLPIRTECERLWHELESEEQEAITHLLHHDATLETTRILGFKGLLSPTDSSTLFSPLLTKHLRQYLPNHSALPEKPESQGIICNPDTEQIWADGEEITWVLASEHQRDLVRLLYDRHGSVVSYREIADNVYGVGDGVTPGAIRELVNRTRRKLPDSGYIINVPGEGYRLKV